MAQLIGKRFDSPDEVRQFTDDSGRVELWPRRARNDPTNFFRLNQNIGAFHMPPGHDAWIVGDEACVLLDFGGLTGYAKAR